MAQDITFGSRTPAATKRRGLTRRQSRILAFYLFISPWLLGFVFLGVIPLILGFLTSMTNYDGLNFANLKFIGFANYIRATTDPDVAFSFRQTVIWLFANLPTWLTLSFILALILNQNVAGRGIFRTLYYLPSIVPGAAAILSWKIILDKNNGLLNGLISLWNPGTAIGWLSNYAMIGMTSIAVWSGLGGGMVIFLAGLQGIPDELQEAAKIDGANRFQAFRHIVLPLMTPVIFFQLVLGLIGAFSQLNLPLLLSNVGLTGSGAVPSREIYLYMIHAYYQIFTSRRYGYGTALLWILCIAVILLTALVFWSSKYWVYEEQTRDGGDQK
jgi:multiple sugar transport system permease protein